MIQESLNFDAYDETLEGKARDWWTANPRAMALFEKFALDMLSVGRRFGIGALAERVRWECSFTYQRDHFKINNNHRAAIARELIRRHPRLVELISLRRTKAEI